MSSKISLAKYLFRRLRQNGVSAIYGVPGDFTLRMIDQMKAAGIEWIGTCNELNAGYAADGYARVKGLGAILTTYGVGELSAINAIAGSFSENVPVVHIVGVPSPSAIRSRNPVHHSLPDRAHDVFTTMHQPVTVARCMVECDPRSRGIIDMTLENAMKHRRPVYMRLTDLTTEWMVGTQRLDEPLESSFTDVGIERLTERFAVEIVEKLQRAKFPLLLVDRGHDMDTARRELNDFVRHSGIPTITMPSGASMVDHDIPNYLGVHAGPVGQIDTMPLIEQADLILAFGPMFSDTQTLGWRTVPDPSKVIEIPSWRFRTENERMIAVDPINTKHFLTLLKERLWPTSLRLKTSPPPLLEGFPDFRKLPPVELTDLTAPINQSSFYTRINSYLRPHDIILLGNATPILGGRDFVLPSPTCRVISSGLSFSIGHMLPAALGAAVAQQHTDPSQSTSATTYASTHASTRGRVVLFDGDGSFQVTAQELSTIIRLRLNVTIFILNNAGYAYERLIHGLNEDYNDIAEWDYLSLPAAFGGREALRKAAEEGETYGISCACLRTWAELDTFLQDQRFDNGFDGKGKRGLKLVDVRVGKTDVPERFKAVFEQAGQSMRESKQVQNAEEENDNHADEEERPYNKRSDDELPKKQKTSFRGQDKTAPRHDNKQRGDEPRQRTIYRSVNFNMQQDQDLHQVKYSSQNGGSNQPSEDYRSSDEGNDASSVKDGRREPQDQNHSENDAVLRDQGTGNKITIDLPAQDKLEVDRKMRKFTKEREKETRKRSKK